MDASELGNYLAVIWPYVRDALGLFFVTFAAAHTANKIQGQRLARIENRCAANHGPLEPLPEPPSNGAGIVGQIGKLCLALAFVGILGGCAGLKAAGDSLKSCELRLASQEGALLLSELDGLTVMATSDLEAKGKDLAVRVGWGTFLCALQALHELVRTELRQIESGAGSLPDEALGVYLSVRVSPEAQIASRKAQLERLERLAVMAGERL